MTERVKFVCPLDCRGSCTLVARVTDGRVTAVHGDAEHPLSKGFACQKARQHLARITHPDRLTRPLRRRPGGWTPVSWDAALDELADRLAAARRRFDPTAVLMYTYTGHGGLSKTVDHLFFNHFGGVTRHRGSLCMGAGQAAQGYDFGGVKGHPAEDLAHSRAIVLWGINPAYTNPRLVPHLVAARRRGVPVVLIDPLRTATAALADRHVAIRPGTDGALALGMAHIILADGLADEIFLQDRVIGGERFRRHVADHPPERTCELTGVDAATVRWLAHTYAANAPAAIHLGSGLQRYTNGGSTVRCIDALGAVTGNLGRAGGGVTFGYTGALGFESPLLSRSRERATARRSFSITHLADFLTAAKDPPVEVMLVCRANPLVQTPDATAVAAAFQRVPFTVVCDMFMTDTARHADLVLPCPGVLEEEEVVPPSQFNPYLTRIRPPLAPPPDVRGELEWFGELARRLGMSTYPQLSRRQFLQQSLAPLLETRGITLEALDNLPLAAEPVPWRDGCFDTPSGRCELFSKRAAADGHPALPTYRPPHRLEGIYPLRLISPHAKASMHSQHFAFTRERPRAALHPDTAAAAGVTGGRDAVVASPNGALTVRIAVDGAVAPGIVRIYQGWWHHSGAVNRLTRAQVADMGEQAGFHDCGCRLRPL